MIQLYLDTSTSYLYAGVVSDNKLLYEIKDKLDNNLSTYSLAKIEKMLNTLQLSPKDINTIIVVNGPGSFTGVRIGITIAKTWAWALNIPIIPISSLFAMAISCPVHALKVPIIDARRDYYYASIYDENNQIILDPRYIKREDLFKKIDSLSKEFVLIGNTGLEKNVYAYDPNILQIVEEALKFPSVNPHAVNPSYLKLTEAEEKLQ